ncbi:MAG TPA: CoA transferase, partial [Acidimicrobiales bacterium]|nr:CoA transferase [Acidimicrobiales bacterium]
MTKDSGQHTPDSDEHGAALDSAPGTRLMAGVKVLDFSWSAAAPIATRFLADAGGIVVRVESHAHPDSIRFGGPFRDNVPGINRSGFFADFNASKYSLGLDMRLPEARRAGLALAGWADVVVESFRPGVMDRWGLSYAAVSARNPGVVYVSSCMFGQSGPFAQYPAYGGQGAALTGIHAATGWPDRLPCGPKGAYTDTIAPYFTICLIVGALMARESSGVGQHIDFAQAEGALQFYGPELAAASVSGDPCLRDGNRSRRSMPHGAFPCRGEDRWLTLDVADDGEWAALASTPGAPEWLRDPCLATVQGRSARETEVEAAIAG